MTYIPDSKLLRGLPLTLAEGYGKPHIGSHYNRDDAKDYSLDENAGCSTCLGMATNSHHFPPLSKGRHLLLSTQWGQFVLKPALIALCGSGTTGCHGEAHSHELSIEWVWERDEFAERWWSGYLLSHGFAPHDQKLLELGHWEAVKGVRRWRI